MNIFTEILTALGLVHERRPGLSDATPIEFSVYADPEDPPFSLYIEDPDGATAMTLTAADAAYQSDNFLTFILAPIDLPATMTISMSAPFGRTHLLGPCDPLDLSNALVGQDDGQLATFMAPPPPSIDLSSATSGDPGDVA
jgi:hypothetical protein